jgi:replicative DNA helicase
VARGLKSLAVDLSCPVVAAAQISREAVKDRQAIPRGQAYQDRAVQDAIRARRPQLHHLREGGSEQEADLVLGLLNYRADFEVSEEEEWPGSVAKPPNVTLFEVGVLKNRYGTPGIWAGLAFEGRLGLLRDRKPGEEL